MPRRVGLFGGTFDPPHIGHTILACEALDQLALDHLLWVLTPVPPHKEGQVITPLEHRLEMVQRALVSYPEFELSRIDIDRPPPHYAVDTVEIAKRLFPNSELLYVIGGDSLRDLPRWHNPASFLDACDQIGVMRRPGDSIDLDRLDVALPGLREKVVFIDTPLLEISSHEIRQRVSAGRAFRQYLMAPVYDYIVFTKLYKTGEESR